MEMHIILKSSLWIIKKPGTDTTATPSHGSRLAMEHEWPLSPHPTPQYTCMTHGI